jgi:hypothetical protein
MHDPQEPHLTAMKRILRYLLGTSDYGLLLRRSSSSNLVVYTDADGRLSRHSSLYVMLCGVPGEQLGFLGGQAADRRLPLQR